MTKIGNIISNCSPSSSLITSSCSKNKQFKLNTLNSVRLMLPVRDIGELNVFVLEKEHSIGKGSGIRFFLLGKQIRHKYNILKQDNNNLISDIVGKDLSTIVEFPIIKLENLILFSESSSLRFLAKKLGEYGRNYYIDFVSDNIASKCERWRDILCDVFTDNNFNQDEDSEYLKSYKKIRKELYNDFENMLKTWTNENTCFSIDTENFTFSDFLLYSVIIDDVVCTENNDEERSKLIPDNSIINDYPNIKRLVESISNLPLINQWIREKILKLPCSPINKNLMNSSFSPCSVSSNGHIVGYNDIDNTGFIHSTQSPQMKLPSPIFPNNTRFYNFIAPNQFNFQRTQTMNVKYPVPMPTWGIYLKGRDYFPRLQLNNEVVNNLSFISNR